MTITALRYLEKAVRLDGGATITFPLYGYEYQPAGNLRSARTTAPNYAYDHLRNAMSPRDVAYEHVRFLVGESTVQLTDTYLDRLRGEILSWGPFWLYTIGTDGTRRKARCRLRSQADVVISHRRSITAGASLDFERYTDWYGETQVSLSSGAITATPTTFDITNPGNLPVDLMEIRLRSNGATGFNNPLLENLTNGYDFQSTRDAVSANSEIKLDTNDPSVKWSDDDGASYADDLASYVLPTLQQALSFRLQPDANSIRLTNNGTPAVTISFVFWAPYG